MTQLMGNGRNLGSGVKMIWIQILVLPFTGWTSLDKLLDLSELWFPYVQVRENKMYLVELLWLEITYIKHTAAAAAAKSLQSCPTLCNPIDGSPSGSPIPGILQARILEWVAISFSNAWKRKVKVKSLSRVWLFATPWTAAYQAPLPMGFSRQEYWSGVPLLSLCNSLSHGYSVMTAKSL